MDDHQMDDRQTVEIAHGVEPEKEEISDSFLCCVCLDILHKPIVLSCGHIACFWCVHRSMSGLKESYCPLCRHPYNHFPTVCQLLHFLLLKKYPVAYKRRELQVLEEEKKSGFFSPQFDVPVCSAQADQDSNLRANSDYGESCANVKKLESVLHTEDDGTVISKEIEIGNVSDEEKNSLLNTDSGSCDQVSVADVLCAACKQLLFHPVVLNCGHVYCESCIVNPKQMLRCQICQSSHPTGIPKVCLELGKFLEEQFPKEYALRRVAVQLKKADSKHENPTACATKAGEEGEKLSWQSDPSSGVHLGVGCDYCGMYPIIGDRYKCIDCVEKIGFDLCSDCHNTKSKLPGRFNQQHTPEHRFEHIRRHPIHSQFRLLTGPLDDRSLALIITNITQDSSEGINSTSTSGDEQDDHHPPTTSI